MMKELPRLTQPTRLHFAKESGEEGNDKGTDSVERGDKGQT